MLAFDIGANRGDWTHAALQQGYKIVALEPGTIFNQLVKNYIYNPNVIMLKLAVDSTSDDMVSFYEAEEDGLSTLNIEWLTAEHLPYAGKPFTTVKVRTVTVDDLVQQYGEPQLIKIDVEGAEWNVLNGMSRKYGMLSFEWTQATLDEHEKQLRYLKQLGYSYVAPQYIEHHCLKPSNWFPLHNFDMSRWVHETCQLWETSGWKVSGLRPTADVGMLWLK